MKDPEPTPAAPDGFREALLSQLKGSGMLDTTRSALRKQLLTKLHQAGGHSLAGVRASSMHEQAMNTVFAEYLGACQRTNTLSVFLAEVSLCDSVHLTHDDILTTLHIPPSSNLHKSIKASLSDDKENGKLPRCFAQALLENLCAAPTADVGINTDEDPTSHAATQLALLDHRFDSDGNSRTAPHILYQKLADLHRQCDERVSLQVGAQVDVIRQIELGQAREEEAAQWRRAMAQQREELEILYSERMRRLRDMEEAAVTRAQDIHHAAERSAYDMRQRMLAEDDRMRASLRDREKDLSTREVALDARETAVTARENQCAEIQAECRRQLSEADTKLEIVKDEARRQAEAAMEKQAADLRSQRTAFESERARIMALQDESSVAVTQLAEKNSRIEALLVSRADAETRANAKATELHLLQCHSHRIQHELELLQQELAASAAGTDLGSGSNGALSTVPHMVDGSAEGIIHIRKYILKLAQSSRISECRAQELQESLNKTQKELREAKSAGAVASTEVAALRESVRSAQALLREAECSLEKVHGQAGEYKLALKHANTELRCLEESLAATKAARDEAIATAYAFTSRTTASAPSPCAYQTRPEQDSNRVDVPGSGSPECVAYPESEYEAPCQRSIDRSVEHIGQRLEMLELEEAQLQEEYAMFQRKLLQQRTALQHSLVEGGGDDSRVKCMAVPQRRLPYQAVGTTLTVPIRQVTNSAQQTTSTQMLEAKSSIFNQNFPHSLSTEPLKIPEEAAESNTSDVPSFAHQEKAVPEDTSNHVDPQPSVETAEIAANAQNAEVDASRTAAGPAVTVTSISSPSRSTHSELEERREQPSVEQSTASLARDTIAATPQTANVVDPQQDPPNGPMDDSHESPSCASVKPTSSGVIGTEDPAISIPEAGMKLEDAALHSEDGSMNCRVLPDNHSAGGTSAENDGVVTPVPVSSKWSDEGSTAQQKGLEFDSASVENVPQEQSLESSGHLEQQSEGSIKLQIVGDDEAESAYDTDQPTSSSRVTESAYNTDSVAESSYNTDENDVEFEGVNFEAFGMELPEEL